MAEKPDDLSVTYGSGNVFADLGFKDPEIELLRAQLASAIWRIMQERGLTQAQAAEIMGVDQPKVSAVVNGRIGRFSIERLARMATKLGAKVEIVVEPPAAEARAEPKRGKKSVVGRAA